MKYLFVHIAKTAGSSVNKFFEERLGRSRCLFHLESQPLWDSDESRPELVAGKNYLAGHRTLSEFGQKLNLTEYFKFTFFRQPESHIVSHLAWIRRLAMPGEEKRLSEHPEYIRVLALKLRTLDFSDSSDVAGFVRDLTQQEWNLLDNTQVRYLRAGGGAVDAEDLTSAKKALEDLDFFGFVESFDRDLPELALAAGLETPEMVPAENSRNDADSSLSENNEGLIDALMPLIGFDKLLYQEAKSVRERRFGVVHGRIDVCDRCRVSGWGRRENSADPVFLDIFVNGQHYTTIKANRPRADLMDNFGLDCAFSCDLSSFPEVPSVVEVRPVGSVSNIRNSPFYL